MTLTFLPSYSFVHHRKLRGMSVVSIYFVCNETKLFNYSQNILKQRPYHGGFYNERTNTKGETSKSLFVTFAFERANHGPAEFEELASSAPEPHDTTFSHSFGVDNSSCSLVSKALLTKEASLPLENFLMSKLYTIDIYNKVYFSKSKSEKYLVQGVQFEILLRKIVVALCNFQVNG